MTESTDPQALFLDDLTIGQTFESETYRVGEEQIKAFAREFDPQPFHLDDTAARNSVFSGLAASGWHTAAITMRLITGIRPIFGSGVIGLGAEIAWPRPVRPDDVLRVVMKIAEIIPSRTRPDRGVVAMYCETFNQRGEVVQTLKPKLVMYRRGALRT
jgi:acyl dehydratase